MNRVLICVPTGPPDREQLLEGAVPLDAGYPKSFVAADFRSWAQDVDRIHALMASDPTGQRLEQALRVDPSLRHTCSRLFGDPTDGIKGELNSAGGQQRVMLDGGRHRAYYLMERGWASTPVWVRADDAGALEVFRSQCHDSVRQLDQGLAESYERRSQIDRSDQDHLAHSARERELQRERSFDRSEFER